MGVVWTFFLSSISYLFFLPLWETARYRLKYCLKGPLNPKQPTSQRFGPHISWLVGCFGLNGPLIIVQRTEKIGKSKNVLTTPTCTYCKCNRSLPYYHPNCRSLRHWKFTQDHRTTRPPQHSDQHLLNSNKNVSEFRTSTSRVYGCTS